MTREQVRATLTRFALRQVFDDLPHNLQEEVRYRTSRWFSLSESAEFAKTPLAADVRRLAAALLWQWTFDMGPPLGRISLDEYFGPVGHIATYALRHQSYRRDRVVRAAVDQIVAQETVAPRKLDMAFQVALARYSRPDRRIYWKGQLEGDPSKYHFELRVVDAPRRSVTIDRSSRTAYRCLSDFESNTVKWLSWNPIEIPGRPDGPPIEVYVQGHTLDRIDERMKVAFVPGFAEHWFQTSIRFPNFVLVDGKAVVLCHIRSTPIGYLHFEIVDGVAVLTTLILATMSGCPMGDTLKAEVKKIGKTIEDLGLDQLDTIVSGKAFSDPVTRDLLERSRLGYLESLSTLGQDFAAAIGDISLLR